MDDLRQDLHVLGLEVRAGFADVKAQFADVKAQFADVRATLAEMRQDDAARQGTLMDAIADLRRDFENHRHDSDGR